MDSINALKNSAIEGAILAAIIIFIFLGKLKPTLIICISIPISILIALTSMYFTNSTINIMTLGGLVLALGRLVDDSIVVMENIFRHRQLGKDSFSAAVDGAKEVGIAVISSTLVSVVVFLPIVFATGIAAQLFKQFGAVVFYSLMGSLFVAFTIVPMLSSKLFKKEIKIEDKKNYYEKVKKFYEKSLGYALSHKLLINGLTIGQINQIVKIAIDGQVASIYRESGEEVDIRVRLKQEHRKIFKDLLNLPINSPFGFIFPLRDVVEINYTEGPGIIRRENSKRVAVISADISGRKLSGIVNDVNKNLRKISFPEGYFYEFGGQEKDRSESFKVLLIALLMSLLIVYMILASLYESLIHPFTILLSVPFAFNGIADSTWNSCRWRFVFINFFNTLYNSCCL